MARNGRASGFKGSLKMEWSGNIFLSCLVYLYWEINMSRISESETPVTRNISCAVLVVLKLEPVGRE